MEKQIKLNEKGADDALYEPKNTLRFSTIVQSSTAVYKLKSHRNINFIL